MTSMLVTGATGGIGASIVAELRAAGHEVLTQDIRSTDDLVPDIVGDLLDPEVVDAILRLAEERNVSVVVAGHGIAGSAAFSQTDLALTERLMRINTVSVIELFNALQEHLTRVGGTFVAISSQAGLVSEANLGVYSASKFALVGWAEEQAKNSSVLLRLLCPGATDTPLLVASLQGAADARGVSYDVVLAERNASTPAGRLGRTAELARATRWLAEVKQPKLIVAPVTGGEVLF